MYKNVVSRASIQTSESQIKSENFSILKMAETKTSTSPHRIIISNKALRTHIGNCSVAYQYQALEEA